LSIPDRLIARYGGETAAAARVSEAAVIELLRQGEMTSGEAAEALGRTRASILAQMAALGIPVANYDAAELEGELSLLRSLQP
jgi:predicted HTH domain antitoxin